MNVSNVSSNIPGGPGSHSAFGIAGAAGLLLEFKHGIPAVLKPFDNCQGFWDFISIIDHMEDGVFLGVFLWLVLLIVSLIAAMTGISKLMTLVRFKSVKAFFSSGNRYTRP